jgi:hypothetical protein
MREVPQRLVFIDETGTTTKLTWLRGRSKPSSLRPRKRVMS